MKCNPVQTWTMHDFLQMRGELRHHSSSMTEVTDDAETLLTLPCALQFRMRWRRMAQKVARK